MPTIHFKGKTFVQNHHLAVKYHQLVPKKELSLTDNVSLHNNLKALKALLPTYAGKIKCIYIGPPYNTGQENEKWVYNDNVNSPMIKDWLGKVVDKEDLTRHDKWLCMMMPRLKLLKELLANEGVIFISIDESEEHHLRNLCDDIFGAENFVEKIVWNKRIPKNDKGIGNIHEYILIYVKDSALRHEFYMPKDGIDDVYDFVANLKKKKVPIDEAELSLKKFYSKKGYDRGITLYCNLDEQYRIWGKINVSWPNAKDGPRYDVLHPKTRKPTRVPDNGWRYKEDTMKGYLDYKNIIERHDGTFVCGRMWFAEDEKTQPSFIQYLDNVKDFLFRSIISLKSSGGSELDDILPEHRFPHPKTYKLLRKLIQTIDGDDFIVLDSFAGSETTAHAVLDLNFEHNTNIKFILVETEGYANSITAERVRRVIHGVPKSTNFKEGLGGTFSYFELGDTIEMESLLRGENLPSFTEFARYLFYTATGEEFKEKSVNEKTGFIGESKNYEVYLIYKPDIEWLKRNALTLEGCQALPKFKGKQRLVFAPCKYVDDHTCLEYRIDFCIGISANDVLKAFTKEKEQEIQEKYLLQKVKHQEIIGPFEYQAKSWEAPQQVYAKVESTGKGMNIRYFVSNIEGSTGHELYWDFYVKRGETSENRIKEIKNMCFSDRLSCHSFWANFFRLMLYCLCYEMFRQIKILITKTGHHIATKWQISNIRLYLLKVGATIRNRIRLVTIKFSKAFVFQKLLSDLLLT